MTQASAGVSHRGRPRSEAVDDAIVAAALICLAQAGYDGLTVSAVAAEAGVSRPAIYRRYRSTAELAAAALLSLSDATTTPTPEQPREALKELLAATAAALASPGAMTILGSLLAHGQRDPGLMATFREVIFEPRHEIVREVIADAIKGGQVRADIDAAIVIDMLFGSLLARALAGGSIDTAYAERAVDLVWAAITTKETTDD